MTRYNNLIEKERNIIENDYRATIKAKEKLLDNQEFLQRHFRYDGALEKLPKSFNKPIKQHALTPLPPPSDYMEKAKRKRDKELEKLETTYKPKKIKLESTKKTDKQLLDQLKTVPGHGKPQEYKTSDFKNMKFAY